VSTAPLERSPHFPPRPAGQELTACKVVEVQVAVTGEDVMGKAFVDTCNTVAVARNGAIVVVSRSLASEIEVFVRYGTRELLARVVGRAGGNYGLLFTAPDPDFWGTLLETPIAEVDPLLITNHEQFATSLPQTVPASQPARQTGERRRSKRVSMRQSKACIDSQGGGPDVVELINISRGGLCFRSERSYSIASWIRIAAPYTPNTTNVFVAARIVRVSRDGFNSIYGAEYVR
jgi:PilZ domain